MEGTLDGHSGTQIEVRRSSELLKGPTGGRWSVLSGKRRGGCPRKKKWRPAVNCWIVVGRKKDREVGRGGV